jgi:signal transduction histidine kinase
MCDPQLLALALRDNLAERLAAAGGELLLSVDSAHIYCREGLFQQVLANLAENALKYQRPDVKPAIRISGRAIDSQYRLEVADNGVGMSADETARAFDPLYRARRVREAPGTGLGLSIVKRIVEAYGGSATVESNRGQGSTFIVQLPLKAGARAGGRFTRPARCASRSSPSPARALPPAKTEC